MNHQEVIDDARSVWMLGAAPQFSADRYSDVLEAVIEERLARGLRKRLLEDARVLQLMNAREKANATEVRQ